MGIGIGDTTGGDALSCNCVELMSKRINIAMKI